MNQNIPSYTFPKLEKLTHKRVIEHLFEKGKAVKAYPFKIIYLSHTESLHQVAFGVPKRNIKLAVHRNKIKRRIREAYRLNKHLLYNEDIPPLAMMVLYHGKKIPPYQEVKTTLVHLLKELVNTEKNNNAHEKDIK